MHVARFIPAVLAVVLTVVAIVEAAALPAPTLALLARGDAASNNPTAVSTAFSTTTSSSAPSITTPAPTVKGVLAAQIGSSWVPALSAFTTYYCAPSFIWSTVGNHAGCCPADPYVECEIAVACVSTSLMIGAEGAFTHTCGGIGAQSSCITGYVTGLGFTLTNMQCWSTWNAGNWNATKTEIYSSSTSSIMSSTTSSTSISNSSTTTLPTAPSSKPFTPTPTPIPTHKSMTGGIIAGVAIGGIAGLVAFISIIVCCLKKTCLPLLPQHQPDPAPPSPGKRFSVFSWKNRWSISTIVPTPPPSPGASPLPLPPSNTVQQPIELDNSRKLHEISSTESQPPVESQPPAELGVACADPDCSCRDNNDNLGVGNALFRGCTPRNNDDASSAKSTYHDTETGLEPDGPGPSNI